MISQSIYGLEFAVKGCCVYCSYRSLPVQEAFWCFPRGKGLSLDGAWRPGYENMLTSLTCMRTPRNLVNITIPVLLGFIRCSSSMLL